jgi:DNA polymerase III subunit delta
MHREVDRVGFDKFRLVSELEKLLVVDDTVTAEHIERHIPAADAQAQVFALVDAIAAGKPSRSVQMMEALLQSGESEFYILSMVAWQFRVLHMIQTGQSQKLNPYVVQKNQATARRFSSSDTLNILTKIAATDFAIKQGKVDARTGLVMLVTGLVNQPQR